MRRPWFDMSIGVVFGVLFSSMAVHLLGFDGTALMAAAAVTFLLVATINECRRRSP